MEFIVLLIIIGILYLMLRYAFEINAKKLKVIYNIDKDMRTRL